MLCSVLEALHLLVVYVELDTIRLHNLYSYHICNQKLPQQGSKCQEVMWHNPYGHRHSSCQTFTWLHICFKLLQYRL